MKQHLFLIGHKGVGKTTLLHRILQAQAGPCGGFSTVRGPWSFGGHPSIHLVHAEGGEKATLANYLFFGGRRDPYIAARFNRIGVDVMSNSCGHTLLVMDELGPRESGAERFCEEILGALDGEIPILGVLQQAEAPFLRRVIEHPAVHLLCVTEENRETLGALAPLLFTPELPCGPALPGLAALTLTRLTPPPLPEAVQALRLGPFVH
ncbi:MAG: hypothetical protein IJF59_03710 [Clostridia bacterium]|nr:hypothetical protein [Clostridia bacterium]MBQ3077344.1 hypothetical protein [Clostridia bacterium]